MTNLANHIHKQDAKNPQKNHQDNAYQIKSYPCPRCQKPTHWQDNRFKPFCSERCKLIDLGAWANEEYKLASHDDPFSTDIHE